MGGTVGIAALEEESPFFPLSDLISLLHSLLSRLSIKVGSENIG